MCDSIWSHYTFTFTWNGNCACAVSRDLSPGAKMIHIFEIPEPMVRTHYSSAHQPPLAARPRTYLLQTGSYDVSIHPRHLSVLPTVVFHPCCRRDIQTTAAVFYLTSSGRSAGSSLYSRQSGVSGFWCHRLEPPAFPRRICAVTRGFQTTTQRPFCFPVPTKTLPYDSCVTITIHHYTVLTPVVLAIINII